MADNELDLDWVVDDEANTIQLQWGECDEGKAEKTEADARECATILSNLHMVRERVEARVGKLPVSGRYHRLPRRLDDNYRVTRKALGKGASGEVRLAVRANSACSRKYAIKSYRLAGVPARRRVELAAEVEVFLSVDHPHIARLIDVYESEMHLYLVMECMEGGELLDRLNETERFAEKDGAEALYQMLLSISYLHSLGIVHRDIKADNFLYDAPGGERLKLIDFGLCTLSEAGVDMADICGTLSYVAPEVLGKCYTSQCDMWSLGVIAFLLLSGSLPFKPNGAFTNQMAAVAEGAYKFREKDWEGVSALARDFTRSLLEIDPAKRLNAKAALQHRWLARRSSKRHDTEVLDDFVVAGLRNFGHTSKFKRASMSMMAWSISNAESEVFRKNFLRLNKDQTGRITFPDLMEALKSGSPNDSSSQGAASNEVRSNLADFGEMLRIFAALDENGDWRVQYTDFLAAMMSTYIASANHRSCENLLHDAFVRFDGDRKGEITVQDLQHILKVGASEALSMIREAQPHGQCTLSFAAFAQHITGVRNLPRSSL